MPYSEVRPRVKFTCRPANELSFVRFARGCTWRSIAASQHEMLARAWSRSQISVAWTLDLDKRAKLLAEASVLYQHKTLWNASAKEVPLLADVLDLVQDNEEEEEEEEPDACLEDEEEEEEKESDDNDVDLARFMEDNEDVMEALTQSVRRSGRVRKPHMTKAQAAELS